MPLPVYRLRRILAATAILFTALVAGMYFYARSKAVNVLKAIPGKMGYDIKQTAQGFQFSKSDGKRTLFTVQAKDVKEFKINGNAELHNVSIILYGRDASRFDQIYGDDFAYNQKTGEVSAKGEVQIDLVSNPAGLMSPDQSTPKELKNPIHLKTRDLVFNRDTGNASTDARVEFSTPQASGSAVGVKYSGKSNTLTLSSQIHIVLTGREAAILDADRGTITNDPRQIVLEHPKLSRGGGEVQAGRATFELSPENHVERVLAAENVIAESRLDSKGSQDSTGRASETKARADQAEFLLAHNEDLLRTAIFRGNVHLDRSGDQPIQGDAGRVVLDFAGQNELQKIHAVDGAHLRQRSQSANASPQQPPQDFDLTAAAIDVSVKQGHVLEHAETSGAAQITILQTPPPGTKQPIQQKTVVTAGKFEAKFDVADGRNHLVSMRGAPDARIVNSSEGQPDRVSTSESVEATFLPQGGIDTIIQSGKVAYSDGLSPDKSTQAWANAARYTPADLILLLTGNPRVTNGGMETTANTIRINRATGDALAEGNVKSTYSELQEQPNGALLASASPIHVTAHSMTVHKSPVVATYNGGARLWQDSNVVEAPIIEFDRSRRSVTAQGTSTKPVQTVLVQTEKNASGRDPLPNKKGSAAVARTSPITITSPRLTYTDAERTIHYEGGVKAKAADFIATADNLNAYLLPHGGSSSIQPVSGPGQLDRMTAEGSVLIEQQTRRAEGQKLVYTTADDKFVLTGGPPSIFDAERGKITGVSLTFFRRDGRVLVEGVESAPVVTTTRVAH